MIFFFEINFSFDFPLTSHIIRSYYPYLLWYGNSRRTDTTGRYTGGGVSSREENTDDESRGKEDTHLISESNRRVMTREKTLWYRVSRYQRIRSSYICSRWVTRALSMNRTWWEMMADTETLRMRDTFAGKSIFSSCIRETVCREDFFLWRWFYEENKWRYHRLSPKGGGYFSEMNKNSKESIVSSEIRKKWCK